MTYTVVATVRCATKENAERHCRDFHYFGATVEIYEIPTDPQTRPVVCLDDGAIYPSAADACRALNLDEGNMSKHLRGKLRKIGGKRFRYA